MITGWWFGTLFWFFYNIWDNPSHWLICFRGVETTNQSCITPVLWSQYDPCTSQYFRTVFQLWSQYSPSQTWQWLFNDCLIIKWYNPFINPRPRPCSPCSRNEPRLQAPATVQLESNVVPGNEDRVIFAVLGLWLHGDDGMLHPRCWFYDMLKGE